MKPESRPSHVAILVPSVRKAAEYLRQFKFEIGEEESFSETKEIYVEMNQRNSLLLMEPKETGSYRRAMEKRGPGLHHLAIDVLNLEDFLTSIKDSGWLLHLNSLNTIKDYRTVYLARPAFPALIEVQEKEALMPGPDFVEQISINFDPDLMGLAEAVSLDHILKSSTSESSLIVQGQKIDLKKLF